MKTRGWLIGLLALAFGLIAATGAFVQDDAQVLSSTSVTRINQKNLAWQQTQPKPKLIVLTFKRLNHLKPDLAHEKKTVYLVVGAKNGKRNVKLYASRDLQAIFPQTVSDNLILQNAAALKSDNSAIFNRGLRLVFNYCATVIDQHFGLKPDKDALTKQQLQQVQQPRRFSLPMALVLALIIGIGISFVGRLFLAK